MNKWRLFLDNSLLLHEKLDICPLLYGSLGLSVRLDHPVPTEDINLLIPGEFLTEKWELFRCTLEKNSYRLTDEREHAFEKEGVSHAYAPLEELESFARISIADIPEHKVGKYRFLLLTTEQYLRVYEKSAKDGYRADVREKKDREKIELIRWRLKEDAAGDKRLQLVYDELKDRYPLTFTSTFALEDGFTEDMPVIVGRNARRSFYLYDDDGEFVFSAEVPGKEYHDHWHPWNVKAAINDVIEFMEEQP